MDPAETPLAGTQMLLFCCFVCRRISQPQELQLFLGGHTSTHKQCIMPSINEPFDARALRRIGILYGATASNIPMMEMPLSCGVLCATRVAEIDSKALVSCMCQGVRAAITPVDVHTEDGLVHVEYSYASQSYRDT